MTHDQAFEAVRQANPLPNDSAGPEGFMSMTALLDRIDERSTNVQTQERPATIKPPPSPGRRPLIPAIAGAVAVIAAIAFAIVVLGPDDGTPDVGSSPQEVVTAWYDLYRAGDIDGYEALMSPAAEFDEDFANPEVGDPPPTPFFDGSVDVKRGRDSRLIAATSATWSPSCTTAEAVVSCTTTFDSPLGWEGPPRQFGHEFTVEDGLITSWKITWDTSPGDLVGQDLFSNQQQPAYARWVERNRPSDYADLFLGETILVSEDSQIERHRALVAEWAADASGG